MFCTKQLPEQAVLFHGEVASRNQLISWEPQCMCVPGLSQGMCVSGQPRGTCVPGQSRGTCVPGQSREPSVIGRYSPESDQQKPESLTDEK